jgi:hypothetical protein
VSACCGSLLGITDGKCGELDAVDGDCFLHGSVCVEITGGSDPGVVIMRGVL